MRRFATGPRAPAGRARSCGCAPREECRRGRWRPGASSWIDQRHRQVVDVGAGGATLPEIPEGAKKGLAVVLRQRAVWCEPEHGGALDRLAGRDRTRRAAGAVHAVGGEGEDSAALDRKSTRLN